MSNTKTATLGFTIENRAGIDVLVWEAGGCQPATSAEIAMWKALSAVQQPVAREPLSEREAFEAAWEKLHGKRPVLWSHMFAEHKMETPPHSEGNYFARDEQAAWKLWQARAALAAQGGKP